MYHMSSVTDVCVRTCGEVAFNFYQTRYNTHMHNHLERYIRAANYLSAVQIYLKDNFLLDAPLQPEHIKERLLGHWGTCPGVNFVYAHLNRAIKAHDIEMMFVLGPGHGFPAIQANLFLEGTLSAYYEQVPRNSSGIAYMAKQFSWPYGFPSHSNPGAPGVILEGGELGYALSTSYGAILDNPDLIVTCVVGDGEAETGPTATAWHLAKFVDPRTSGAVLPILHLNGYKISGPTIMGRMSDEELVHLFKGYGYEPHIVDVYTEADPHARMSEVLDVAIERIRDIQRNARACNEVTYEPFPMIIFRSPKGWGSIKELHGKRIEDNHYAHQVIADDARTNVASREALETWLRSYNFSELYNGKSFHEDIEALVPAPHRRMGSNQHTTGGDPYYKPLILPDITTFCHEGTCRSVGSESDGASSMEALGAYLREVIALNDSFRNMRIFSPDETYSNKLDAVFATTKRVWMLPNQPWDKDMAHDGRVIEMLSEHSLQGLMQGYVLTGRHAVFASYEAFMPIVGSMADQYAKFLHVAREVSWRGDVASLNYILTSGSWRQEHNGFSHQNPGFIDDMLQRQGCFVNVYFPTDMNTALACMERMLISKNEINLIVLEKRPVPCWRTQEEALKDVEEGLSVWDFASEDNPHVVFCAVGDYLTKETLAAITVVRSEIPAMRMRFVNIVALSALGVGDTKCRVLPHDMAYYFTEDKHVVVNFHGYPQTIKQMLFDYGFNTSRFTVHGYNEQGSTTTPFDMFVRNKTDRFSLAMEAFVVAEREGLITVEERDALVLKYTNKLNDHRAYAIEYGTDPDEITNWVWTPRSS